MKSRIRKKCLLIIVLLLCTACTRQEAPSGMVNDVTEEAGDTKSTEADAKSAETYSYIENEDTDNRFPRLNSPHLVQVGQYYFGSFSTHSCFLNCYDTVSKTNEIVCSKPDCTHDNEDCNAFFMADYELSLYHDHLYWLGTEGEGKMKTLAIRRMDPFAGTRESVRSVDWIEIMQGYWPQHMRVHRGTAYLECKKQTIVEGAPDPKVKLSLLSMLLSENGETKILFERDYDCCAQMLTRYCGNYIYLFCTLWTLEPAATWYEIYKVDLQNGECKAEIAKLEPDCYFDDFWVDNDYRLLAAGHYKNDYTKSFVWQVEDGTVKERFSFEAMSGDTSPFLVEHIAVNVGYVNGERSCCICNFDGKVLYDGKLTLPTQIPDLYPGNCKISNIDIVGGDEKVLFVSYKLSGKGISDNVLVMYDLKNNMEPTVIWQEHEDVAFGF